MTETSPDDLRAPRTAPETRAFYDAWAPSYDAQMTGWGYAAPARLALALRRAGANPDKPALDFGCGTGLSGLALRAAGFAQIDGTDISTPMLDQARARGVYQHLWDMEPGEAGHLRRGAYPIIAATGVIGPGAAPAETLDLLLGLVPSGGLLGFTLDDAALNLRTFNDRLDIAVLAPDIEIAFEEDGPHLPALGQTSTVFVLRRT